MKIKIISGANLNVLERRGKEYGEMSYEKLVETIEAFAHKRKVKIEFFVSNYEGELIDEIQNVDADALIVNFGAYSHYSLAIADALRILAIPKIEVHITNIHKRDRHITLTGAACDGVISGLGIEGYKLAIEYLTGGERE